MARSSNQTLKVRGAGAAVVVDEITVAISQKARAAGLILCRYEASFERAAAHGFDT